MAIRITIYSMCYLSERIYDFKENHMITKFANSIDMLRMLMFTPVILKVDSILKHDRYFLYIKCILKVRFLQWVKCSVRSLCSSI